MIRTIVKCRGRKCTLTFFHSPDEHEFLVRTLRGFPVLWPRRRSRNQNRESEHALVFGREKREKYEGEKRRAEKSEGYKLRGVEREREWKISGSKREERREGRQNLDISSGRRSLLRNFFFERLRVDWVSLGHGMGPHMSGGKSENEVISNRKLPRLPSPSLPGLWNLWPVRFPGFGWLISEPRVSGLKLYVFFLSPYKCCFPATLGTFHTYIYLAVSHSYLGSIIRKLSLIQRTQVFRSEPRGLWLNFDGGSFGVAPALFFDKTISFSWLVTGLCPD